MKKACGHAISERHCDGCFDNLHARLAAVEGLARKEIAIGRAVHQRNQRLEDSLRELRDMFRGDVEDVCRQQCAMENDDWRTCTHCVIERINASLNPMRPVEPCGVIVGKEQNDCGKPAHWHMSDGGVDCRLCDEHAREFRAENITVNPVMVVERKP